MRIATAIRQIPAFPTNYLTQNVDIIATEHHISDSTARSPRAPRFFESCLSRDPSAEFRPDPSTGEHTTSKVLWPTHRSPAPYVPTITLAAAFHNPDGFPPRNGTTHRPSQSLMQHPYRTCAAPTLCHYCICNNCLRTPRTNPQLPVPTHCEVARRPYRHALSLLPLNARITKPLPPVCSPTHARRVSPFPAQPATHNACVP